MVPPIVFVCIWGFIAHSTFAANPKINNINPPSNVYIDEDIAPGTEVFEVDGSDSDGDLLIYVGICDVPNRCPFVLDYSSGKIFYTGGEPLDADAGTTQYNFDVELYADDDDDKESLSIRINDVNESPVIYNLPRSVNILETETGSVDIFDVDGDDPEGPKTYTITSTTPLGAPFTINPGNGKVSTATPSFDYSSVNVYTLNIELSDGTNVDTGILTVNIDKVNQLPTFDDLPDTIDLNEEVATPYVIYTVDVTDTNNDALVLEMASHPDFSFNPGTGDLSLVNTHDFETGPNTYVLKFRVNDGSAGGLVTSTLTVNFLNINEPCVIDNLPVTLSVIDSVSLAVNLYQVLGTDDDGDTLTYSILSVTPIKSAFSITPAGMLRINNAPAFDAATENQYTILIQVTDPSGLTDTGTVTVDIINQDQKPVLTNLDDSVSLPENQVVGGTLFTVTASDPQGEAVEFTMTASPADATFSIDKTTGVISYMSNPNFDHEITDQYILTIYGNDNAVGGYSDVGRLTVDIIDVNEPPTITNLPAAITIPETTTSAATIFSVLVSDEDDAETHTFTLSVTPAAGATIFSIDTIGNILMTANPGFSFEVTPIYYTTVTVTDSGGLTNSKSFDINIADQNELPTFYETSVTLSINEGGTIGDPLSVNTTAVDPDNSDTLTLSIVPSTFSTYFTIHPTTGALTLAKELDLDDGILSSTLTLQIAVTDSARGQDRMSVVININEVNDNTPIFKDSTREFNFSRVLEVGDILTTVAATDLDIGPSGDISYSLTQSTGNYFTIDSATGVVSVLNRVPATVNTYDLYIKARDMGSPTTFSSSITLRVTMLDMSPAFHRPFYNFEIRSDAYVSDVVGHLSGYDRDIEKATPLSYHLVTSSSNFQLLETTGMLEVKNEFTNSGKKYVLYAITEDNEDPTDEQSSIVTIRVDTYKASDCIFDFHIGRKEEDFTDEVKEDFIAKMSYIDGLPDAIPRIMYINMHAQVQPIMPYHSYVRRRLLADSDTTTVSMIFLKGNYTENLSGISQTKDFYSIEELSDIFMKNEDGDPTEVLKSNYFTDYDITKAQPHYYSNDKNWWLETPEGIFTTSLLSMIGFALTMYGGIGLCCCLPCYCCQSLNRRNKRVIRQRPESPEPLPDKKRPPTPNGWTGLFNFRYNSREPANLFERKGPVSPPPSYRSSYSPPPVERVENESLFADSRSPSPYTPRKY